MVKKRIVVVFIVIIVMGLTLGGFLFNWTYKPHKNTVQPAGNFATITPAPVTKTYTSQNLGIRFRYAEYPTNPNMCTQEVGDKIYINYCMFISPTPDISNPYAGQFVQVLPKNPLVPLEETVRKKFLSGYSVKKCLSTTTIQGSSTLISFHQADANQNADNTPKTDCPSYLVGQAGASYFRMDSSFPNKYLFFELGGGIFPGDIGTWDSTLTIFK